MERVMLIVFFILGVIGSCLAEIDGTDKKD